MDVTHHFRKGKYALFRPKSPSVYTFISRPFPGQVGKCHPGNVTFECLPLNAWNVLGQPFCKPHCSKREWPVMSGFLHQTP